MKREVSCTVTVSHRSEDLSAHVVLDDDLPLEPGDEVTVHGPPVVAPWGEVRSERRRATVTRASWLRRLWTRTTGNLGAMALVDE